MSNKNPGLDTRWLAGFIVAVVTCIVGAVACIATILTIEPVKDFLFSATTQTYQAPETAILTKETETSTIEVGNFTEPPVTRTNESTRPPIQTLIPTQTATETLIPTPTKTIVPTPTEVVLYFDNFDDGRFEGWTIISGEPIGSSEGRLNAFTDVVEMSIGDNTWKNYQVELDVYNAGVIISNLQDFCEIIGFRVQDARNMIGYFYALNLAEWRIMEDGVVTGVPGTVYDPGMQNLPHKLTIVVQDNQFKVVNGEGFPTDRFPTGGVYLRFCRGTVYDNFKVTLLP